MVLEKYYDRKSAAIWWKISIAMLRFQQIVPSQTPSNHPICFNLIHNCFHTEMKNWKSCFNLWGINLTIFLCDPHLSSGGVKYDSKWSRMADNTDMIFVKTFMRPTFWGRPIQFTQNKQTNKTLITTIANLRENSIRQGSEMRLVVTAKVKWGSLLPWTLTLWTLEF